MSLRGGKSIICDDTVSGTGNFLYASQDKNVDFDDIFDAFLYSNKLFVTKTNNLWTVSKIKIENIDDKKITINSYDCTLTTIFEKISEQTGKSIIYEVLPLQRTSIHIQNQTVFDTVRLILEPYSEYLVTENQSAIQISKKRLIDIQNTKSDNEESICNINYINGEFDIYLKNVGINEVLNKLFMYSNESFSSFLQDTEKVSFLSFNKKSFENSLLLILDQISAEFVYSNEMWYLFQKVSKNNKEAVLERDRKWHTLNLNNFVAGKIIPLVTVKFPNISIMEITNSIFAVYVTDDEFSNINEYVTKIDKQIEIEVVKLKYIKTNDLFAVLPPNVTKDEIVDTGTGNSVFFIGSESKRNLFLNQLKEIDKPKKLIRYDLLILQYEKNSNLSWGISNSNRPMQVGDRTLITGEIGNLLNISFDAITSFGLAFSEKINTAIANNEATVFADTTLYGLSGEKLTFKNTNTYRYRDATLDPDTGREVYSTVTREITSGLVLEIDGWVSGEDIITMSVNTSVSKQGVDVSNTTGNPPPTTEKNITTKIRARNGEPVVLSGLSQNNLSNSEQGVPGISKIPLLGNLFKNKTVSNEKTEMTIYLVPHIEESPTEEKNESWEEILLEFLKEKAGKY